MKKILFWIFSAALAVAGTAGAMAQAEYAAKVKAPQGVTRMLTTSQIAKAQENMAEMQAREAAAAETATSQLRRAVRAGNFASVAADLNAPVIAAQIRTADDAAFSAARVTETDGNLTITKDANGIITDVTGGETRIYQRSTDGTAYFSNNGSMTYTSQSGNVTIVVDGNNYYIKDPITRYTTGAWVKGVKEGNNLVVATHQPLNYSSQYSATISLRWGLITAAGSIANADANGDTFVYAIDGDVLTLQGTAGYDGTADVYYMGAFWDDDNSNTGYGDAATVLTYDAGYVPPSTDLVVLPNGVTVENWYLNAVQITSSTSTPIKNREAKVAFDGNDVYVAMSENFPNSWVKGTISGTTVSFANFQYAGQYSTIDCWFAGTDGEKPCDYTATYDATAKTLTFNEDVLVNAATDRIYYLEWISEPVLSAEEVNYEEPILTTLTTTLPYANSFETDAEVAEAAIYDANDDGKTFALASGNDGKAMRCGYNSAMAMDDYITFPGMPMVAGTIYEISIEAACQSTTYTERVEVLAGTEAKVSALTSVVIAPTDVVTRENTKLTGLFTPATSGTYYIAVHGCSDADKYYLFVDNFSVMENNPAIPAAVSDLAVAPDANAEKKATVTFTVPTKNIGGTNLTGNLDVVIKVDDTEVYNESKAPGAAVSYVATVETPGTHKFTAQVSQNGLVSDVATVSKWVGVDVPAAVSALALQDNTTTVKMSWQAPTTGANNGVVLPADLKYNVYPVEMVEFWGMLLPSVDYENPLAVGVTGTSCEFEYNTCEGEMGFTYFAVAAENEAGEGTASLNAIVTGTPYALPMFEPMANQTLNYYWTYAIDDVNYDDEDAGLFFYGESSDDDGYCLLMNLETAGWVTLSSGKVALANAVNPVYSFDLAATSAATVKVSATSASGTVELATLTPGTSFAPQSVSLKSLAAELWVILTITVEAEDATGVLIDNIKVMNLLDNNLALLSSNIPASMKMTNTSTVTATVANYGSLEANGAKVELIRDGAVVDSQDINGLASMESTTVSFEVTPTIFEPESAVYSVNVNYAADQDLGDNKSDDVTVTFRPVSSLPAVTDLSGAYVAEGVKLTWSEPNLEGADTEVVVEDFENAEAFSQEVEGWTIIDEDDSEIGGFQQLDLPSLVPGEDKAGFFVFESTIVEGNTAASFAAQSGTKFLAALFRFDDGAASDWAITPTLSGHAQTISFYARSYSGDYPEKLEIYWGNGTTLADFPASNLIQTIFPVPSTEIGEEWTKFEVDVPEGATNVAFHSCATGAFMLQLDDVSYEVASLTSNLSLVGYDVYRDGVKVNTEAVGETEYLDATATDGAHVYNVVVNYNKGISPVSNSCEVQVNGLNEVAAGVSVKAVDGAIVITGAEGEEVAVSAVNGMAVYAGVAEATTTVAVSNGVYLVKVGTVVVKVIVK